MWSSVLQGAQKWISKKKKKKKEDKRGPLSVGIINRSIYLCSNKAKLKVLCPHMSELHQDRKFLFIYYSMLLSNLSPRVEVTVLLLFVTAWPIELEVDSTCIFKGCS